jgi:hypothetical protein
MEENRPWWDVRTSNPSEVARLPQAGSTPALFRHSPIVDASMILAQFTDFDDWLVKTFAQVGWFTLLIVLVDISETTISPLASSYVHVIGDETRWTDIVELMSGAGVSWNGAAFLQAERTGLVDDSTAQKRLSSLTKHLEGDRSILVHSELFNAEGHRLKIEEIDGFRLPPLN